ncbi:MAG: HEPN domain-containing protein [Deltaproteobacteria bacterium]|nr:HEPN domain-containing protein [Deltaproteobacteria bacterium]
MTPQSQIHNANEALTFSERFLTAAQQLAASNLYDRATSQLYYAVFHAVRALLFTAGIEPRSHRSLRSLFRLHFVKNGLFLNEDAVFLDQLSQEREDADYVITYVVDIKEYEGWLTQAQDLIARIKTNVPH